MINIYLDENLSACVALALNFLNKGDFREIQVFSAKDKFGKGIADEIIIPGIGKENGALITRDINIHKTRFQYDLCKQHKIGVFFLILPKGHNKHWGIMKLLVKRWEFIQEKSTNDKRPFAYRIKIKGKIEKIP